MFWTPLTEHPNGWCGRISLPRYRHLCNRSVPQIRISKHRCENALPKFVEERSYDADILDYAFLSAHSQLMFLKELTELLAVD
jgi:hypothetical protein